MGGLLRLSVGVSMRDEGLGTPRSSSCLDSLSDSGHRAGRGREGRLYGQSVIRMVGATIGHLDIRALGASP